LDVKIKSVPVRAKKLPRKKASSLPGPMLLSQGENPFSKGFSPWNSFLKLFIAL
jgi:hypothetical protein